MDETRCPVCQDNYLPTGLQSPRILPCGHSECGRCVHKHQEIAARERENNFRCPVCRTEVSRACHVPENRYLREMIEKRNECEQNFCAVEGHEGRELSLYCANCKADVCPLCIVELHSGHSLQRLHMSPQKRRCSAEDKERAAKEVQKVAKKDISFDD